MNKKILYSIIIIAVIIMAAGSVLIFMPSSSHQKVVSPMQKGPAPLPKPALKPAPTMEQQIAQLQNKYPAIITGVIKFLDTKSSYKTILTTSAGITYILWPAQPEAVYESFGVKNGGKVQVNGKDLGNGKLGWALMKPI